MSRPTVYRLVWERSGVTMRSDWTTHYDLVREFLEMKKLNMPGTNARLERARVKSVDEVQVMDFSADGGNNESDD